MRFVGKIVRKTYTNSLQNPECLMRKLKQSELKQYREEMLKAQGGKCAFCGQDCKKPCLDHAHMKPYKDKVRGVICNWCNIAIGKLENARVRTGTSWTDFHFSFPAVSDYVWGDASLEQLEKYRNADWHPSKRKSELIEFKKLNAKEQKERLEQMEHDLGIPLAFAPRNEEQRIKLFKKLNNKT